MIARVGCVILAAGEGRRYGAGDPKALAPFRGKLLLQHAIDAASQSRAIACTLVVGASAELVVRSVDLRRCAVVENTAWREGIASSIRAGLRDRAHDDACVLLVADQPFVTADDINGLVSLHESHPSAIAALRVGDVWGTPMLFPRGDFEALFRRRGNAGAKRYAQEHVRRLLLLDARSDHAFLDVDTPDDLERAAQALET